MKNDYEFTSTAGAYEKCYHKHPPLPITIGNPEVGAQETVLLYGGSCLSPAVTDADIYIGFDLNMDVRARYPWDPEPTGPQKILFPIQDGSVPKDFDGFNRMLDWIAVQLIAGKKVHMGCIGGHGRTGLVMAALVTKMTGEKDSIAYVRKHYCEKVVESKQQVDWLHHNFGITKQTPSYELRRQVTATTPSAYRQPSGSVDLFGDLQGGRSKAASSGPSGHRQFSGSKALRMSSQPTTAPINLWGGATGSLKFDK